MLIFVEHLKEFLPELDMELVSLELDYIDIVGRPPVRSIVPRTIPPGMSIEEVQSRYAECMNTVKENLRSEINAHQKSASQ